MPLIHVNLFGISAEVHYWDSAADCCPRCNVNVCLISIC